MISRAFRATVWAFSAVLAPGAAIGADYSTAGADRAPVHFNTPLTLVELTGIALQNNPQTRGAWAAVRASEAGLVLAKAGYWPQISATLMAQNSESISSGGFSSGNQTRYGPSISLSYLLWDFGVRAGSVDRAQFQLAGERLTRQQVLQDVILQVEQAYYQVLGLSALLNANQSSLHDAEANLDAAGKRKSQGLATIGDVYQAEAAVSGARLALQQTRGQLAAFRGRLASVMGYSADTFIPLQPWGERINFQPPARSIAQLLAAARSSRPELLAAKAQEQVTAADLRTAIGQGLPSLTLDAGAGRTGVLGQSTVLQYRAQLNLEIPLFAGFAHTAAERQARAELTVSQASTAELLRQVELEVWQAYQGVQTAAVTLKSSADQLRSATQAIRVTQARYRNGLDSILNVLSAQSTLATARVQHVQAQLDWFAALAALGHAVGGLGPGLDATAGG